MTDDSLLRFRDQFPILHSTTYLVSNSLGAMPRAVPDRLKEYADQWATRGVRAWAQGWWEMPIKVGDEIAPLIGAGAGEVAMVPNVTIAQAQILSSLDYRKDGRDTIVMTEMDFPSVRYVYDALATKLGARIVVVPSDDGISIDEDRLLAAIDERTRLVSISHVLFRSAYILDAARICAHAHRMGALVALDAYHSVGVVPVDVKAMDADFLTGGVLKWLCGGPGGSFLWVSPKVSEISPALTGWQAHEHPFAFEPEMSYASGAWGWLTGTPVIPALFAASEGPRILREATMVAIREKSVRQTSRLIELADARGFIVTAPRDNDRRAGTVAFDVPHAREVAQALLARDVIVDYRPGAGIRVAPHFYTTDGEVESVVEIIDEILAKDAWKKYTHEKLVVT
ncbi:MAG: aminotransferase class [Gemmatimonadetes bacterium]|nr:aminotransferase class [Gemmatimonadota bacterium]